jgi:hypothetical protein
MASLYLNDYYWVTCQCFSTNEMAGLLLNDEFEAMGIVFESLQTDKTDRQTDR